MDKLVEIWVTGMSGSDQITILMSRVPIGNSQQLNFYLSDCKGLGGA